MNRGKLTQADVVALPPGRYADGDGLYLQVAGPERRSWIYRYALNGKQRWHGLGSARDVTLAAARKVRDKARALVRTDKVDPVAERQRQRRQSIADANIVTFRKAAETFIAAQQGQWTANHAEQWAVSLRAYAYPFIGDMPVAEITRADVIRLLDSIWIRIPETARRVRGRIEAILDWAIARGDRPEGENPASRGPILRGLPKHQNGKRHHPAMPYGAVPAFLKELGQREGMAALALHFAILTAARTGEVRGARWAEIDRVDGTWTVPAERMKTNRPHRVPLTDAALSVLDRAANQSGFIFPSTSGKPLSNMALLKLLGRMGKGEFTVRGFRSAFRTWVAEETEFDGNASEAALAHIVGDKVEAAYRRGTLFGKRRRLMEAWAAYCGTAP
jgi:integrase